MNELDRAISMIQAVHRSPDNVFFRCVEDSNEAIMICNPQGILVYVNPAWCKIYGYSEVEALGKTPGLLHSGIHSKEFYSEMWSKIRNPQIAHWKGELVNKSKKGELVPVLLTITPFKDMASSQVSGYMGIALDMTSKKELEAKVAHQDRLASIGMLASGLAHEIGTPLGVVRGRAELMIMQAENLGFKKNLTIITSEIDRISKLIRSLLRVSRSFSDVIIEDISPSNVLKEIILLVGQNFKIENIEIINKVSDDIIVRGDFGRLEQVFLNLMMNALHAIQKKKKQGQVTGHFVKIFCKDNADGFLEINVEDSGCGIPPENMKKLFKPFFTTKDVGEGTGLGLAIVAQLVREMEGAISVQSVVGEGTVFTITLKKI